MIKLNKKYKWIGLASLLSVIFASQVYAEVATTTQPLRVIIPKIALIDTDNTYVSLPITFTPMTEAGDNFATTTATGAYDITSNIRKLRLYAKTDVNLESTYNLKLEVNEAGSFYRTLTTTPQRVSTLGRQARKDQALNYRASPAFINKTIPYGNIDVTVTYTLVEP